MIIALDSVDSNCIIGVETTNVSKWVPENEDPSKEYTATHFTDGESIVVKNTLNSIFKKVNIQKLQDINR